MSHESPDTEYTTVGTLLQQTRIKLGLDLENISDETKITVANLKAIEDNDFNSLPAEAFARGFYALYAKTLNLDPSAVLHNYSQEKAQQPETKEQQAPPPYQLALQVRNLARRPTAMPVSYTGLFILILLLVGAFVSWYFSWNPASFLSEKLRNFRKPPESEQVINSTQQPDNDAPLFEIKEIKSDDLTSGEPAAAQPAQKTLPTQ